MIISHGMQAVFTKRWHSKTSSFHLPIDEMTITLDDVLCLLPLPIRGKLLGHGRIDREEGINLMVTHLGIDPIEASHEAHDTRGVRVRFCFLENLYKDHMQKVVDTKGDDMQVGYHRTCALRCYLLFLVATSIFVYKNATYFNVVYLQYFIDLTAIHEYN